MLWVITRTVSESSFEHPEQMFKLTDRKILVISAIKWTRVCATPFTWQGILIYKGTPTK